MHRLSRLLAFTILSAIASLCSPAAALATNRLLANKHSQFPSQQLIPTGITIYPRSLPKQPQQPSAQPTALPLDGPKFLFIPAFMTVFPPHSKAARSLTALYTVAIAKARSHMDSSLGNSSQGHSGDQTQAAAFKIGKLALIFRYDGVGEGKEGLRWPIVEKFCRGMLHWAERGSFLWYEAVLVGKGEGEDEGFVSVSLKVWGLGE